ncbi:hypothetical protein P7C73_g5282, partial [Tremellales sp. Uapishka_1]
MQKRALKQLGKVTQWTNEKVFNILHPIMGYTDHETQQVFSGEKTQLSEEFTEFEQAIDVRREGIERLHATSMPYFSALTKAKPTPDPYPPAGSGKEKILVTEALGLVMISYGEEVGGSYGDGLTKYGRARCRLAQAQEELSTRMSENYIAGMENALAAVNDYKTFRKKLDSRRLTLDAAITRLSTSKKDSRGLEEEVKTAQARFDETEEETQMRMVAIQDQEEQQFLELTDLLEAEMEYFSRCQEIMEDLRKAWPSRMDSSSSNRPRAKSNASARSMTKTIPRSYPSRTPLPASSEEEAQTPNRARSQSNASAGKSSQKKSMMSSLGSMGKKGGLAAIAATKPKSFGRKDKDDQRQALNSEEDTEDDLPPPSPRATMAANGRARSQSILTTMSRPSNQSDTFNSTVSINQQAPPMRRTHTTPTNATTSTARFVKAIYEFNGTAHDELPLRVNQIVEITSEVSTDWFIGRSEGRSGLFPSSYTEEYVPTPTTAVPPKRTLPPLAGGAGAKRTLPPLNQPFVPASPETDDYLDHEHSDLDSHGGFSDSEHHATAPLQAPPPVLSRTNTASKKAPPPPPPSRRSRSSSNVSQPQLQTQFLAPPLPSGFRNRSNTTSKKPNLETSPEGSPFAGSEDEAHESGAETNGACSTCGCEDFTQNVFKSSGTCSTCFRVHG